MKDSYACHSDHPVPAWYLPCQGLSFHSINPCASQAPRALRCPPSPAPTGWQHSGFGLDPQSKARVLGHPIAASPTHCVTLNRLSSFSKLCCPHLQSKETTGSRSPWWEGLALWLRKRPPRRFAWKLELIVLTERKRFLGVAGVLLEIMVQ